MMLKLLGFAFAALVATVMPSAADTDGYAVYAGGAPRAFDAMLQDLSKADVVFVGENHDDAGAHRLELAILQGLHRQNPAFLLSMEMFERDSQEVLNEYLDGYITETHFLQAARPWPNYKTDYRPLIEFCKDQHIPVVAANAPRRYVNIVSRKGQQALLELPAPARAYMAPLPYAMDLPPGYDRQLDDVFGSHDAAVQKQEQGGGKIAAPTTPATTPEMPSTTNMKQAQGLWDATMADSILHALRTYRGARALQINGGMHSDSGYGIVARLRKAAPRLKVMIVSIKPASDDAGTPLQQETGLADFVIVTQK